MTERKFVRALSSGDILAYEEAALKSRAAVADRPIHKMMESLLSTESGFTNFRGFVNWGLILLLIFGGKMVLNNFNRYGIIMDPFFWRHILQGEQYDLAGLVFVAFVNVHIFIGFFIERIMSQFSLPQSIYIFSVSLNLCACILFPTIVVLANDWSPFFTSPVLMLYIIVFLKLWSYAMVNTWCRTARAKALAAATSEQMGQLALSAAGRMHLLANAAQSDHQRSQYAAPKKGAANTGTAIRTFSVSRRTKVSGSQKYVDCADFDELTKRSLKLRLTQYPDNLTFGDIYYFLFAPTLCYELNFPQTFSIRKRFLLKRVLELICLVQLILLLIQQWMVPALQKSVSPFIRSRSTYVVEHLLNIAIPNHVLWLLGFYAFFHSYLNVVAEMMKFGDRRFYEDWWNATSVPSFWSSWNIPVHRWCRRHVYKPILSMGFSRFWAGTVVFFVSAIFHELLVSVPLKMLRLWAFLGMLGQQPYALLVYHFCPQGGKTGNIAVWLTLIVGQPLALYMYFHDYYVQQQQKQ
uniref:O-acyltransferase n=1 Tax=Schistocephalus solidus TaxID=70667 RepID=A0A0X3Q0M9_SCHSO